ncbi:FecR family protein [Chitinophaga rupis]|nr:FecR domain-containing protein [Chitinophaga rupis]
MSMFHEEHYIRSLFRVFDPFIRLLRKHPPTNRAITVACLALFSTGLAVFQRQLQRSALAEAEVITLQTYDGHILPIVHLGTASTHDAIFTADSTRLTLTAKQSSGRAEWNTLTVPRGYTYSAALTDGSLVRLNAGSSLRFPSIFGPDKREVYMEGEAYFEAQDNANRSFTIHSGQADIIVLGTAFNVNTYDQHIRVSLVSGEVMVNVKGKMTRLKPGLAATIDKQSGQVSVTPFEENIVLAWLDGLQIYVAAPLRDICNALERMYNIRIHIDDPKLLGMHYSVIVNRQRPIQNFLEDLKATRKVHSVFDSMGELHLNFQ